MQEYVKVLNQAHTDWLKARAAQDFGLLEETLTKVVAFQKEFIPYWQKEEKTPYDVLLNQFEPGMTVEKLDQVFDQVKQGIQEIRTVLAEKGTPPRTDFLSRKMTKEQQRRFVIGVSN